MGKKLVLAVTAAALAAGSLGAGPAQAGETHVCNIFAPPYDQTCQDAVILYCKLTPRGPLCH
jgi:hypothetical protein